MSRPLILISNDDGYEAKGFASLIEMMRPLGDVIAVAPDSARSGASLSITSHIPLRTSQRENSPGLSVYSCSGTPCDCVKIAFEKILPRRPDLVLSGINHGDNAAINAHYSGTVAVAIEGCMKGVPSIAFSSCRTSAGADFSALAGPVRSIAEETLLHGLPAGVCLNVNFPDADHFKAPRICKMGGGEWVNEWEERTDPRHRTYYWLTGKFVGSDTADPDSDLNALHQGHIAVTPIQLDLTAYAAMKELGRYQSILSRESL